MRSVSGGSRNGPPKLRSGGVGIGKAKVGVGPNRKQVAKPLPAVRQEGGRTDNTPKPYVLVATREYGRFPTKADADKALEAMKRIAEVTYYVIKISE